MKKKQRLWDLLGSTGPLYIVKNQSSWYLHNSRAWSMDCAFWCLGAMGALSLLVEGSGLTRAEKHCRESAKLALGVLYNTHRRAGS